jgi:hypothetical protein
MMAQVPPELQLLHWISRVNAATDANDAIIYGAAPAAIYPARPSSTAPVAEHTAYIIACQQADEARDAQFPHGGPALNHKPTDAELKTILLNALATSTLDIVPAILQPQQHREDLPRPVQRHPRPR